MIASLKYFDLNERARKAHPALDLFVRKMPSEEELITPSDKVEVQWEGGKPPEKTEVYGDAIKAKVKIRTGPTKTSPSAKTEPSHEHESVFTESPITATLPVPCTERMSMSMQILMYCGILIGVVFSSLVNEFASTGNVSLVVSAAKLVISFVAALIIVPNVYEKLKLDPTSPFIVQFGLFVQNGMFWQIIFTAISRTV